MRDIFNVFCGFGNRTSEKKAYNLVNAHDHNHFANSNNPYHATTTTVNDRKEMNGQSESLSTYAVLNRLFKGRLTQKENQSRSEYFH